MKAWPLDTTADRVGQFHAWMSRAGHLPFIPMVFAGVGRETTCVEAGRLWDCCRWQPGDPLIAPMPADVESACEAVAQLHLAWGADAGTRCGPCPGVLNRLRILSENESLLLAGPDGLPPISPQLDPLLRQAVRGAASAAPLAAAALQPWATRILTLQPCVRDLRGDHVLFERNSVSGIIDFGAIGIDHPAVDLARLLIDYTQRDESLFAVGIAAYRRVRGEFEVPDEFVRLLSRSGAVCSVLGWLVRLVVRREAVLDFRPILSRLEPLVVGMARLPLV